MSLVHDNSEKAGAFRGLVKVISMNPNALVPHLAWWVDACCKWNVENLPEMKALFMSIFVMFRNAMGEKWQVAVAGFPPNVIKRLREVYGL